MQALFVVMMMIAFEYWLSLLVHKVWDVVYNKWTKYKIWFLYLRNLRASTTVSICLHMSGHQIIMWFMSFMIETWPWEDSLYILCLSTIMYTRIKKYYLFYLFNRLKTMNNFTYSLVPVIFFSYNYNVRDNCMNVARNISAVFCVNTNVNAKLHTGQPHKLLDSSRNLTRDLRLLNQTVWKIYS